MCILRADHPTMEHNKPQRYSTSTMPFPYTYRWVHKFPHGDELTAQTECRWCPFPLSKIMHFRPHFPHGSIEASKIRRFKIRFSTRAAVLSMTLDRNFHRLWFTFLVHKKKIQNWSTPSPKTKMTKITNNKNKKSKSVSSRKDFSPVASPIPEF